MKNITYKTNKRSNKKIKRIKKTRKIIKKGRRNKFSRSRRSKRQRGGNYNAQQIQQITDTIKANDNLRDITDEEISEFINKINPTSAIFANVHHLHSRFPHLLDMLMNIETHEELQEFGDDMGNFFEGADNTDFESEPEPDL
jgi:hypothetical protein